MTHARILAGILSLCAALGGGCSDNDVYVMSQRFELKGGERVPAGGGCMLAIDRGLGGGASTGGGFGTSNPWGDLKVTEQAEGEEAFVVVVMSEDEELERRRYSEKQLLSGEHDTFTVTTHAGHTYELSYWGGHECDTSHLQHDE